MINLIEIKNFLSHKDTKLELSPGINCVTGSSDSGKSAIAKALHWLKENRPQGTPFASHWITEQKKDGTAVMKKGEAVSVKIKKEETEILRQRCDSENNNGYAITGQGIFSAIRGDVPEPVQKALNLTDVNIQKQFDSHFLLSESAGEVARFFNKIIKLDKIDYALKNIESMRRKTNNDLESSEKTKEDIIEKLNNYDWIEKAEKILQDAGDLETEIDEIFQDCEDLAIQISDYKIYSQVIKEDEQLIIDSEKLIKEIKEIVPEISSLEDDIEDLSESIEDYEQNQKILKESLDYSSIEKKIQEIRKLELEIEDLEKIIEQIDDDIICYKEGMEDIKYLKEEIKELEDQMPSVCPICKGTGKLK